MSRAPMLVAFSLAIVSLILRPCFASQPGAADILKRSQHAAPRASFTGRMITTVYGNQGPVSANVKIYQRGTRSRMEYVSGPSAGRTIIDDGARLVKLDPREKTACISETPSAPDRLDLVFRNYRPRIIGSARVAGRDCYAIGTNPLDKFNASKKLWIDKQSLVTLKIEKYDPDGTLECRSVYTSIDYSAQPSASLFAVPSGWKTVHIADESNSFSLQDVRKAVGFTPKKPAYVPKGYVFDDYCLRSSPDNKPFAGFRYTNGMNTISVFEGRDGASGRGATGSALLVDNPQMHLIQRLLQDITVIVAGNVAERELKKMADSFK